MTAAAHTCTADCWAYLLRNGQDDNTRDCDPWTAFTAANTPRADLINEAIERAARAAIQDRLREANDSAEQAVLHEDRARQFRQDEFRARQAALELAEALAAEGTQGVKS